MIIEDVMQRVCNKQPLFTSMLYRLQPRESTEVPTAGTDGEHLFYNKKFMESLTPDEQCAVLLHEVFHNVMRHVFRKKVRSMDRWNVATDFAINPLVEEDFKLPKGSLINKKYADMSAEEIYAILPKQKKQDWCDKDGWASGGQKKEGSIGKAFKKAMGKEGKDPKPTMSPEQLERIWKQEFSKLAQNYGNLPASLKRLVEKKFYIPTLDWVSLISSILSEDTNDYTFSNPDRRFLEEEFVFPGLHSIDTLKDVIFAYDTSGSITSQMLQSFYSETLHLFDSFSNLQGWLAICDTRLYSFKEVNGDNKYEDFDFMGGGGTSFEPVFEEIAKRELKPKAVFYFSDTEGYFPDTEPDYPVFWLVPSYVGDMNNQQVPFGTIVKFLPNRAN